MGRRRELKPLPLALEGTTHAGCPVVEVELSAAMIQRNAEAERARAELERAKTLLRAAGFEFKKPRRPPRIVGKNRVGPTFVARFADGVTTRTSVYTELDQLDWERGRRVAIAAYESRTRPAQPQPLPKWHPDYPAAYEQWLAMRLPAIEVPVIVEAHFEQDGVVLATKFEGGAP